MYLQGAELDAVEAADASGFASSRAHLEVTAATSPTCVKRTNRAHCSSEASGELFALRKGDVDFDAGVIMVSRSHDRDIPKGGRVEAVPINEELVFPNDDGTMLPKHTALEHVLRRAMRRAGLVTGYVHKCRRQGCGHQEAAPDANPRWCPGKSTSAQAQATG